MLRAPGFGFSFGVVCSSGALLLLSLCSAARAAAEPQPVTTQPMQPGLGMVSVHLTAREHSFAVYFGRGRRAIADCVDECEFWAWPDKYRVLVRGGEGPGHDATLALHVQQRGRYEFVPAHGGAQNAGLVLGSAGPALGLAGLVVTTAALLHHCGSEPCNRPFVYVGIGGMLVGAGMSTVGWLLYAHHRAHFDFSGRAQSVPRVGIACLPGGLGLGATLPF